MTQEQLIVILCLSVLAVPISAARRNFNVTIGAIIMMFISAIAIAFRVIATL